MKTIKLTFVTDAGKSFPVSMNYADPELTGTEGVAKVQAAVAAVIALKRPSLPAKRQS